MQKWYNLRPTEVRPLLRDSAPTKVFLAVVYARSAPIVRESQTFEPPGAGPIATASPRPDEHCAEKIILLKHLAKIERETGWKTSDRAAELRSLWGFV
ncbi:hypothetical protein N7449_007616 [Penicillium cf. viridicatum]|uniref:Uncharacterized protein n=1 Tax=Penicillium cf. viridicatum TaxID=2972119 RepID=A0A9W9MEC6_9EURO|nr:hypothetical protein N7449_007616 [Penicillium cf. viridicatum]